MEYENQDILKELAYIEQEISTLKKKCEDLPEGRFYCAKNGKYTKWYLYEQGKVVFLSKSEKQKAQKVLQREFCENKIEELALKKSFIEKYQRQLKKIHHKIRRFDNENSDYRRLLKNAFVPNQEELQEWMRVPYDGNPYMREQRIYETTDGNFVRSKSEVMICTALQKNGVPYRYECPLDLGDGIIYPDFTIMHPRTRKIYYWEHAGMLDNLDYLDHHLQKERRYIRAGIYPDVNLILTHETKEHPLTPQRIERTIQEFFL